jgi:hypothetical protein
MERLLPGATRRDKKKFCEADGSAERTMMVTGPPVEEMSESSPQTTLYPNA